MFERSSMCASLYGVLVLCACSHSKAPEPTPAAEARVAQDVIELDLVDVELYEALRTLSMKAQFNLFLDPDLTGKVTYKSRAPWEEALAKIASDHQLRVEPLNVRGATRPSFWVTRESSPPAPQTEFTGEKIVANLDETPVRDAAKTLAEVAKIPITVDPGVDAQVTLHMRLPWDLALYHLAQKYKLRIVRTGNSIRIASR
jgi:type II secretory pathway component HofQ